MITNKLLPSKMFGDSFDASMIINAFLVLDGCPSREVLATKVAKLQRANKRMRAVPRDLGVWELIEPDADDHISYHSCDTMEEALDMLKKISLATGLPGSKPLFHVHVVDIPSVGKSRVLFRFQHGVGDGLSTMECFIPVLFSNEKGEPPALTIPRVKISGFLATMGWYLNLLASFPQAILQVLLAPMESNLPCFHPDRKNLAIKEPDNFFFPPISLTYIRSVKNAAGCSVNDIMFTAWGGALRRLAEQQGFVFNKKTYVSAALPVNYPHDEGNDSEDQVFNFFSMVPVQMDVSSPDCKSRLKNNKVRLDKLKKSLVAFICLWVTDLICQWPKFLRTPVVAGVYQKKQCYFFQRSRPAGTNFLQWMPCL